MTVVALDTLAIVRKLQASGLPEGQAEAITTVIRESRDTDLANLVTKSDLREAISDAKFEILKWVLGAIGFQTIVIVGSIVALSRGLH